MPLRRWDTHRIAVVAVSVVALIAGALLIHRVVWGPAAPRAAVGPAPTGLSATAAFASPSASPSPPAPSASPSPSAAPSASLSPGPPSTPVPAGFPSPQNTGWRHTGVKLTVVSGVYAARRSGEVLDAKDFRGGVRVSADNVTIKRSRVQCGNCPAIWVDWNVRGTVIEDVEITSKSRTERIDRAITAGRTHDLTIRRVHVHDTQRGIEYGYSALIEDSYVDDEYNPTAAHVSAVGGAVMDQDLKLVIRHNWIAGKPGQNNSAALLYYYETSTDRTIDLLIERNILNGGTYALWLTNDPGLSGKVTVRDNLFGTKYHELCGAYNTHFADNIHQSRRIALTWEGNAWHSPGTAKHGKPVTYHIPY